MNNTGNSNEMRQLDELVRISRYYGEDPDYTLAGGGNTSFKNRDRIWIKASGIPLAGMVEEGFVCLSRKKLGRIGSRIYSRDPVAREEEVRGDIQRAVIAPAGLRPSVETSLHNLIGFSFVVHTHPTRVNGLLCARGVETEVGKRFGKEALYVEYTDPGYVLFKNLQARVGVFRDRHGRYPGIIFLQNHGVFVGADSPEDVQKRYREIEQRIEPDKNPGIPTGAAVEYQSEFTLGLDGFLRTKGLVTRSVRSPLIDYFTRDKEHMNLVSRPLTPDMIVYCKSAYLLMGRDPDPHSVPGELQEFERANGYVPRIILVEGAGLTVVGTSPESLQIVLDVFSDLMKVSFLTGGYGGPNFMTPEQIRFINNWEVEHYRRKVAGGS